ncbi:MAG: hypothetical protein J7L11_00560 [Thermoprotei archaeon]|nr:hypothetical protein [Thermoprotei archaeon]
MTQVFVFATGQLHYHIPGYGIKGRDFPAISLTGSWCLKSGEALMWTNV